MPLHSRFTIYELPVDAAGSPSETARAGSRSAGPRPNAAQLYPSEAQQSLRSLKLRHPIPSPRKQSGQ